MDMQEKHNAKEIMLWENFRASSFFYTYAITLLLPVHVKHSWNNPLLQNQSLIYVFCMYTWPQEEMTTLAEMGGMIQFLFMW